MKNFNLQQIKEFYHIALILHDIGFTHITISNRLEKYYSKLHCNVVKRFMEEIEKQDVINWNREKIKRGQ